jgi:hypothetical protein
MAAMGQGRRNVVWVLLITATRWARNNAGRWKRKQRPPAVGVREPRRPKPTLPAAAIALAEPRTDLRRRIKLINLRDTDR